MIKSRSMRWAGHVAHMGKKGLHIGHRWECRKEKAHYEDIDIGWRIILRRILER
jgi:hypothetical protein